MRHVAFVALSLGVLLPAAAYAQATPQECLATFGNDRQARLDCYDAIARNAPQTKTENVAQAETEAAARTSSTLARDWNLSGEKDRAATVLGLQPYKLNYILAANWTNSPNRAPFSPTRGAVNPSDGLDSTEVKFQFSLKSQIVEGKLPDLLGFNQYRVWFAYTQQSMWQAYNSRNSSPFRDTMYEPEVILTLGQGNQGNGFKLLNIGFNHQSNGRSDPYSRSWFRTYIQAGFEYDDFTILGRAWWRIHEARLSDDNPDIDNYVGRGDLDLRWDNGHYAVDLLLRDNLSFSPNRGFAQLDVSVPWLDLKFVHLHFQATTGYGETLLDYNHKQSTVGVGFAFGDVRGKGN